AGTYKWNGIDVYQDGAGQRVPDPGECFVFRVRQNQLAVAQRIFNTTSRTWGWGTTWTKSITMPSPTQGQPGNPAMLP
ncbi:MAG: hypothetical protein NT018_08635, partial [Armatimonadetes bacterium]|nr:hypothetical protein [Armatimonadota bacterium]